MKTQLLANTHDRDMYLMFSHFTRTELRTFAKEHKIPRGKNKADTLQGYADDYFGED